jgi:WD40 repeat protein
MLELVKSEISKKELKLTPDSSSSFFAENNQDEREFDITVTNSSDRFASFQIELWAKGTEHLPEVQWYKVDPMICAKKPPGDRTTFHVIITKAPVPAYNTIVELTVKVLSVESERLSTSETVLLKIGEAQKPLKLFLPITDLKVYPSDRLVIPALVHNLSPRSTEVTLSLKELDPAWVKDGAVKSVRIGAGDSAQVELSCIPPQSPDVQSGIYNFEVEARDQLDNTDSETGTLEVLPNGYIAFSCSSQQLTIPPVAQWFSRHASIQYQLQFINQSALLQRIQPEIQEINQKKFVAKVLDESTSEELHSIKLLPEAQATIPIKITPHRPWVGREQQLFLQVTPQLSHPTSGETSSYIQAMPNTHTLELRVRPWVPFWLLGIGGLLGLFCLVSSFLTKPYHTAPVNSVRLISNASTVVSGSSDQTIQRWQVLNFSTFFSNFTWLRHQREIADSKSTGKAVRVIREIPAHEGKIAAGLENGRIQLWNVSSQQKIIEFSKLGDRVFDLVFTQDSKNLFSGHGSSQVRRWDLQTVYQDQNPQPDQEIVIPNTAISALAVSEQASQQPLVAIAGQFNQLVIWNPDKKTADVIDYQLKIETPQAPIVSSRYDYINSLAVSQGDFPILVTADSKGWISTWSMSRLRDCTRQNDSVKFRETFRETFGNVIRQSPCPGAIIETWKGSDNFQSINAVAITKDGRYVAGAGEDGRVKLWQLNEYDKKSSEISIKNPDLGISLKSVDIQQPDANHILITSNAPHNQVNLINVPVGDQP